MYQSLREYTTALGRLGWLWLMDILSGLTGLYLDVSEKAEFPTWVWVILLTLGLMFIPFIIFHKKRVKYDEIKKQIVSGQQIERDLTELARLRAQGIALRNNGLLLKRKVEVGEWIGLVRGWKEFVAKAIVKVSVSEANIFLTDDLVDTQLFKDKAINEEHAVFLALISQNIEGIKELVEKLAPLNLARWSGIEKKEH